MIRTALIDDHNLFREGIRFLIEQMEDVELVIDTSDYDVLMEALKQQNIDVLLLDLNLPQKSGIDILQIVKVEFPAVAVIILTMHQDTMMMLHLMELGASSYLLKDTSSEELYAAIKAVHEKGVFFNEKLSQAMLSNLKNKSNRKKVAFQNQALSVRELEVLTLICKEYTAKEIAEALFISQRTAEGHRKNLIQKLGVKNTAGLIVKAFKEKLIDIEA